LKDFQRPDRHGSLPRIKHSFGIPVCLGNGLLSFHSRIMHQVLKDFLDFAWSSFMAVCFNTVVDRRGQSFGLEGFFKDVSGLIGGRFAPVISHHAFADAEYLRDFRVGFPFFEKHLQGHAFS
jgi:hypothetical protein